MCSDIGPGGPKIRSGSLLDDENGGRSQVIVFSCLGAVLGKAADAGGSIFKETIHAGVIGKKL